MKQISILLLIGFASFSLFGFFAMHMGMQDHDGGCLGGAVQAAACPKDASALGFISQHLEALKAVSSAIFAQSAAISFAAALAVFVVAFLVLSLIQCGVSPVAYAYARHARGELFRTTPKRDSLRWLALHENSPALR